MTGWSVTSAQQGDGEHQGDRACASVAPCPHGSAHEVLNSPLWQLLDTPVLNMDCIEAMAAMPQASVDAIVCDPPYGLEFMGSAWDRLDWRDGGGFSKTGLGDRPTEWTSYGAETANPSCRTCGGRLRGAKRCECNQPDWHVAGEDFDPVARSRQRGRRMQEWHERWAREALQVLKPGGHLLAAGASRTHHRLICALEDAGFEIRDCITHHYSTGFPKSMDVSKAIEKAAAAVERGDGQRTAPASPEAERWQGWGTALKPSTEFWVLARKPLESTVAANLLAYGTGALNINATRVGWGEGGDRSAQRKAKGYSESAKKALGAVVAAECSTGFSGEVEGTDSSAGRWPPNVVFTHAEGCVRLGTRKVRADGHYPASRGSGSRLAGMSGHSGQRFLEERYVDGEEAEAWECVDGCPVKLLDEQSGVLKSGDGCVVRQSGADGYGNRSPAFGAECRLAGTTMISYGDQGGASRFFPAFKYQAKPSPAERHAGVGELGNRHPTVKSIDLMRWLVRLVTPPGALVLDPFCGSGSTGAAAALEGVRFIGIERDQGYAQIARARIRFWSARPAGVSLEQVLRREDERQGRMSAGQLVMDDLT